MDKKVEKSVRIWWPRFRLLLQSPNLSRPSCMNELIIFSINKNNFPIGIEGHH